MTDHQFYSFITFACAFLVLDRMLQGFLGIRRWIERRAARDADAAYAAMRRAEQPEWDPEFLS